MLFALSFWSFLAAFLLMYQKFASHFPDMPLTFALHTTFPESGYVQVPLAEAHRRNERLIPTHYGPLNETEKKVAAGFDPRGTALVGYFRSGGHTARIGDWLYTVSDNFDHWIVYNGGGNAGFLCVEPQAGRVNGLNDGGFIRLAPGRRNALKRRSQGARRDPGRGIRRRSHPL